MPTTIQDLHKLAYTRFPKESVHQILHDAAYLKFHCQSLSECNPEQLDGLRRFVMDHPVRNAETPKAESRNGEAARPFRSTARPRSGTPIAPGTIRLASDAQRGLIRRLFSELGWSESTSNNWLLRFHGIDTIPQIGTVQAASKIIHHLMRIKADKPHGRPGPSEPRAQARGCSSQARGCSQSRYQASRR